MLIVVVSYYLFGLVVGCGVTTVNRYSRDDGLWTKAMLVHCAGVAWGLMVLIAAALTLGRWVNGVLER